MKTVMGVEWHKKSAFASPEEKRAYEIETNRMLDFLDFSQAMKLLRRLDYALFKERENIQQQREVIFAKIYEMQAGDNSLSFAKCWDWLRKEQPKLFERLPEILAAGQTIIERRNQDR